MSTTHWYRSKDTDWDTGLAHDIAVFGDEEGTIRMSLASFDTLMARAGYDRIRSV